MRYNEEFLNSSVIVYATTNADKPGAPMIRNIKQIKQDIKISWTRPAQSNGPLRAYLIKVYELPQNGGYWYSKRHVENIKLPQNEIFSKKYKVGEIETDLNYLIDGSQLRPQTAYAFTVQAENSFFVGNVSKPKVLNYDVNLQMVKRFNYSKVENTKVTLEWEKLQMNKQVKEQILQNFNYKISYKPKDENEVNNFKDITVPANQSKLEVNHLSPDTTYIFVINAVIRDMIGPDSPRVRVSTTGKKWPKVLITAGSVFERSANSINLTWEHPPHEKNKDGWDYAIFYGVRKPEWNIVRNITSENSFTVRGLEYCESYVFFVAVAEKVSENRKQGSFGPRSKPYNKETKYSPVARPKNVKAVLTKNGNIELSWDASCPKMNNELQYQITAMDAYKGVNNTFKLSPDKLKDGISSFRHTFDENIHYGTTYTFWVQTSASGSQLSRPAVIRSNTLPSPAALNSHLDFQHSTIKFTWLKPSDKSFPPAFARQQSEVTYTIYLSKNHTMYPIVQEYPNLSTEYLKISMNELDRGVEYFAAAKLVDKDGYESVMSGPIGPIVLPITEKEMVVEQSNVAGVLVGVILIICILGVGLGYYFVKHRKLRRSFEEFASRYSPAGGGAAAIFSHNLLVDPNADDDDTNPIIRGFSDSEPLVVS